jgi:DNA-binding NarL/FixJ family response regulator
MGSPLRIAIADEHALFRQGLRSLLQLQSDVKVVAEIERFEQIPDTLDHAPCDILLLYFPISPERHAEVSALATRVAVIWITAGDLPEESLAAIGCGVRAVVFRRLAIDNLVEAIRAVARGQAWIPPTLQARVMEGLPRNDEAPLSAREREVAQSVARGLRNVEVARALCISEQTVKTHLNNIFHKLGLRDRVELTLYAARRGWVGIHGDPRAGRGSQSAA